MPILYPENLKRFIIARAYYKMTPIMTLHQKLGVSRKTIYKWLLAQKEPPPLSWASRKMLEKREEEEEE